MGKAWCDFTGPSLNLCFLAADLDYHLPCDLAHERGAHFLEKGVEELYEAIRNEELYEGIPISIRTFWEN